MSENATATDMLSSLLRLINGSNAGWWIGGWRDASNPPFFGWQWSDGTPADNLNCGSAGCNVFLAGQPKYVGLHCGCVA